MWFALPSTLFVHTGNYEGELQVFAKCKVVEHHSICKTSQYQQKSAKAALKDFVAVTNFTVLEGSGLEDKIPDWKKDGDVAPYVIEPSQKDGKWVFTKKWAMRGHLDSMKADSVRSSQIN